MEKIDYQYPHRMLGRRCRRTAEAEVWRWVGAVTLVVVMPLLVWLACLFFILNRC